MGFELDGIGESDIRDQVAANLKFYSTLTMSLEDPKDRVVFDIDAAVDLKLTPDKYNSARSCSVAKLGEFTAELFVIVFRGKGPDSVGDGTGDESARTLESIVDTGQYPRTKGVVPRDKTKARFGDIVGVQAEAHLTIATFNEAGEPMPFVGLLDLIGYGDNDMLVKLGSLGQTPTEFNQLIGSADGTWPTTTYTVLRHRSGLNFGDQHAVYNNTELLQVCGFIAIPRGQSTAMLRRLDARLPEDR